MSRHAVDRVAVEQVAVKLVDEFESVVALTDGQGQVECRNTVVEQPAHPELDTTGIGTAIGNRGQIEHDLKHGGVAECSIGAQRFDEFLERQTLMCLRVESDVADTIQQLRERRIAADIDTQNDRINKEANQLIEFDTIATGDRRTDEQIGLPRVAMQQHVERAEHDHEQCAAVTPTEIPQCVRSSPVNAAPKPAAVKSLLGRPGPIGW